VRDNGIISFDTSYIPSSPSDFPYFFGRFVAPFWANTDLRGIGEVFYRHTTDPSLLKRATSEIRTAFPQYFYVTMKSLFIATWYKVGYYENHLDKVS